MKKRSIISIFLILTAMIVIGAFLNYSYNNFRIDESFTQLPLNFNPTNATSSYDFEGAKVTIEGGFAKGMLKDSKNIENLILRALSPTPSITVKNTKNQKATYYIRLENVNPIDTKILNIEDNKHKIIDSHTILTIFTMGPQEVRTIKFAPKDNSNYSEIVILGDNRDGYGTFSQIIQQLNFIKPIFVVDNGDLVYGGQPNKYRLFYEIISKLQVPLLTTLGNHDIRKGGRKIYTELFGPPYYSFNYRNFHFVFLDSSRGWTEKTSIPEPQYKWLETDLKKAQGKRIFVISHIPSTDPRVYKAVNALPQIPNVEKNSKFEEMMNDYSQYKSLNHGFPDKAEAKKFESIMTKYKVDTVFTSHIHSYYSFIKNNVRYVISGGAGAELLTTDSYYHYLRIKLSTKENYFEMVELPSPQNTIQDRYIAAISLFTKAIIKEYKTTVIIISIVLVGFILLILYFKYNRWWPFVKFIEKWLKHTLSYAIKEYRNLKKS